MNDQRPGIDEATAQWRLVRGDLAPDETVLLTVQSGSMLPLIPVGARLEVSPVTTRPSRVGDIVVFRQDERLVAHRLIFGAGELGWFLQRGDGWSPTGVLRARSILGRVVAVHETGRAVVRLTGDRQDRQALREARRSLARFVHSLLERPARKVRRWLTRGNTGSA